jgi:hypothetical protein
MPITNQPIKTHRSMGSGAQMFGIISPTLMPGITSGFLAWMAIQFIVDDHRISGPIGAGIVFTYWLFVGNSEQKAWKNLSRFIRSPRAYIGGKINDSIIEKYRR